MEPVDLRAITRIRPDDVTSHVITAKAYNGVPLTASFNSKRGETTTDVVLNLTLLHPTVSLDITERKGSMNGIGLLRVKTDETLLDTRMR
jgi:DUF1365 family protein